MLMRISTSVALCLLIASPCLASQITDSSCSTFSGTWYGAFRVVTPDGKSTRYNAVIVLAGDCGHITGSAGSGIDQQMPISSVQVTGDEIRFHMDPMGGLDFKLKRQGNHLSGTASGKINVVIDVQPAPGLLPHEQLLDVLILEGTSMAGTEAAWDFVSDDKQLMPFLQKIHKRDGAIPHFELVLGTNNMGASAVQDRVLTWRTSE